MTTTVLLKRFNKPEQQQRLNPADGKLTPAAGAASVVAQGNFEHVGEYTFCLYVERGRLYFQADQQRWDFQSPACKLMYRHDIDRQVTQFSVAGKTFEYPAWWRNDPRFEPCLPELDEENDYLGYIFALKDNERLQNRMIEVWGKAAPAL